MTGEAAVLLPVRSFRHGKTRLGPAVPPERRHSLARAWARRVRAAAGDLPVTVMTADPEVADWAASTGAGTIADAADDLNGSVGAAVAALASRGSSRVIVAHADLPLADDLTWLRALQGVVIVPDRRVDGTNVLAVPATSAFAFGYGPRSSHHHEAEARRLGLPATVVGDPVLGWDVDVPDDLVIPQGAELERLRRVSRRAREAAPSATTSGRGRVGAPPAADERARR